MDNARQFQYIGERQVIGWFFMALEQYGGAEWINRVSNAFTSNIAVETYAGLGNAPIFREWIGAKKGKSFNEFSITITNRDFESTIVFKNKDLRRDKTGQIKAKIGEFAQRVLAHDALLISGLIDGGASTTVTISGMKPTTIACYDGQALWSASHTIGATAISNAITLSVSALATTLGVNVGVGTTTAPQPVTLAAGIQLAVQQLYGFKDDQGQPLNEFARDFTVMVPVTFSGSATQATKGQYLALGYANPLLTLTSPTKAETMFAIAPNPRLTHTDTFYVFRSDSPFKAIIRQIELLSEASDPEEEFGEDEALNVGAGIVMKVLGPGSDFEHNNAAQQFSLEKSGMVGNGRFDTAVSVQLVS